MPTVTIHQPNYLPWAGYFYKMMHCDIFIILDNVQYIRRSVINRNKIKGVNGEIMLTVPVQASRESLISDVKIADRKVLLKHLKSIQSCYAKAPYFAKYFPDLEHLLGSDDELAALNESIIRKITHWLGIECSIVKASNFDVNTSKDQRLVDLVCAVGGDTYLSGTGGKNYQREDTFHNNDIALQYTDFVSPGYPQLWGEFIPNLSVLDILFNCGPVSHNIINNATRTAI